MNIYAYRSPAIRKPAVSRTSTGKKKFKLALSLFLAVASITAPFTTRAQGEENTAPKATTPSFMLVLYPNPFASNLNLVFTNSLSDDVQLDVIDLKGNVITGLFKGTVNGRQPYPLKFNGDELADGVYLVRLITSTGVYNNRIILHKEIQH